MIKNNKKSLLLPLILGFGMISCHKPLNTKNWTGQMRGIPTEMPTIIEGLKNQKNKIEALINFSHRTYLSLSFNKREAGYNAILEYMFSTPSYTMHSFKNKSGTTTYRLFAQKQDIIALTKLCKQASSYKIQFINKLGTLTVKYEGTTKIGKVMESSYLTKILKRL